MFKIPLFSHLREHIFPFIRQVVIMTINAFVVSLAFYGFFWLYRFLPESFETTLSELTVIKPNTIEYRRYFMDLYRFCLSIGVFFVLAEKVVRFVCSIFSQQDRSYGGGIVIHRKMTPQDIQYVGAHEAGHLLAYAALGQLPQSMKVEVKEHTDGTASLGYVSAFTAKRVTQSRLFIEWEMLTLLAGREGESTLLQDNSLGSVSDHCEWFNRASVYLKNYFEGIFYIEPSSRC